MTNSFDQLGLSEEILAVLSKKGFEEPTPIQAQAIPLILKENKNFIGQARTGTGKTAAFGLPILELLEENTKNVQALILTPTRELAIQVAEEIHSLKGKRRLNIVPIYGGQSIEIQLRSLRKGIDIVVGTPGRILDHLKRRSLKLQDLSFLVLDEADEMLNLGFIDDVKEIMSQSSPERRIMLFSATMPPPILQIANEHMGDYETVKIAGGSLTVSQTDQIYFEVSERDKFEALCRIVDMEETFYGLIFCRTKVDVDSIATRLMERGYGADALHGDVPQTLREKILNKFKRKLNTILVATDVAARGIDVNDLTHVINYALPQDAESYVHRIGRTGRAGKEGNAVTFITPEEYRKLQFIKRETKTDIRKAKLPEVKDIIVINKKRIKSSIEEMIEAGPGDEYSSLATALLEEWTPEEVAASLLQLSFQDELNEKNYASIREVRAGGGMSMKGRTRLFVTQGRQDGLTKKQIVKLIKENCRINERAIQDIQILDKFSFVSLPFQEAEILLSYFKRRRRGGKGPVFSKAKFPKK